MILSRVLAFVISTLYSSPIFFPSLNRNEDHIHILGDKTPKTCDPTPYKYGEIKGRNRMLFQAGLAKLIGLAGETNIQVEEQKKHDVLSNEDFIKALVSSGRTRILVSEEDEEATFVEPSKRGKYGSEPTIEDVLQPVKNMLAAGCCMYGSSCVLMLSTGTGVDGSHLILLLESSY